VVICLAFGLPFGVVSAAIVVSAYGLVLMATSSQLPALDNRLCVWLGGVSYAIYLLHQNVGYVVIRGSYQAGVAGQFAVVLALGVALLVAGVLRSWVEVPAARLIRRKLTRRISEHVVGLAPGIR
jgi:peptidoglycan/LPS O-acetylase OafA/YrhL